MPHIAKMICMNCNLEMYPVEIGKVIEMMQTLNEPYYKIYADILGCGQCGYSVAVTAQAVVAMHFDENYGLYPTYVRAYFRN